ncbi:restriction endonuclease [Polymorphospora lycopeni]|uniref:Restriction endonuclease n=1 Tax=Polymorphospora lycopeni TaxID=3140240 RepID=A0ABV5CJT7_9ACTN
MLEKAIKERTPAPFVFFACIQDTVANATMFEEALESNLERDTPHASADARPTVRDWKDAETLAVWHMRRLGFADATASPNGNDRGVDVVSADAMAQVKHYASGTIGAPVVQQARGAAHGKQWALFYALSDYTVAAREFAEQASVALFQYDVDGNVTAISSAAHALATSATDPESTADLAVKTQELTAKSQALFDDVFAKVMTIMRQTVAQSSQPGRRGKEALDALDELHEVREIVDRIGQNLDLREFLALVEELNACGRRAAAIIGAKY